MAKWYSAGQRIGDILLGMVKVFKVYTNYVNNYNASIAEIGRLKKTSREFKAFLNETMKKCGGHDLSSYLVLPIQRIPRYVLLFEELSKYTPEEHPDSAPLRQVRVSERGWRKGRKEKREGEGGRGKGRLLTWKQVVVDIRGVADYVNQRKRAAENQLQVLSRFGKISNPKTNLRFVFRWPSVWRRSRTYPSPSCRRHAVTYWRGTPSTRPLRSRLTNESTSSLSTTSSSQRTPPSPPADRRPTPRPQLCCRHGRPTKTWGVVE